MKKISLFFNERRLEKKSSNDLEQHALESTRNQSSGGAYKTSDLSALEESAWNEDIFQEQKPPKIQNYISKTIHTACEEGDLETVSKIIRRNVATFLRLSEQSERKKKTTDPIQVFKGRINARDNLERTALHYAAINNNTTLCKLLYKSSKIAEHSEPLLDVCAADKEGCVPLHYACFNKQAANTTLSQWKPREFEKNNHPSAECIQFLLSVNTEPVDKMRDAHGHTALHWAVKKDFVEAAFLLIFSKCQKEEQIEKLATAWKEVAREHHNDILINAKNYVGNTPLHTCANHRAIGCASLLLKAGCNANLKNFEGINSLMIAANNGDLEMCKKMIKLAPEEMRIQLLIARDNSGKTALHYSIDKGYNDISQFLLKETGRKSLGFEDNHGNTLLIVAASAGSLQTMVTLIEMGADIHQQNSYQCTALSKAILNGRLENVKELLKRGADVNVCDVHRRSPLIIAVFKKLPEIVKLLLDHGSDFTYRDTLGENCMHKAALANHRETFEVLLDDTQCFDAIVANNLKGNNPFHLAASNGNLNSFSLVLEKCERKLLYLPNADQRNVAHLGASNGHVEVLQEIAKKDSKIIASRDVDNNTPLHLAAKNGRVVVLKYILRCENSLKVELNDLKQSPLICAAAEGHAEVVELLIQRGFDIDQQDSSGSSALHIAADHGYNGTVALLLRFDADVTLIDTNGNNPLGRAIASNHEECVMEILRSPKWRMALRNIRTIDKATGEIITPLRQLIRLMPNAAKYVLDRCTFVCPNHNPEDDEYLASFDYEFIEDLYNGEPWKIMNSVKEPGAMKTESNNCYFEDDHELFSERHTTDNNLIVKNHPINLMATSKNIELLSHPLVESLAEYKWALFGRKIYFSVILVYLVFLLCLNIYILTQPPPYAVKIVGNGSDACFIVEPEATRWQLNCTCCRIGDMKTTANNALRIFVVLFTVFNLAKEVVQLTSKKMAYFQSVDNYFEITTYVLAFLSIINFSETSQATGIKEDWQWVVAAYAVFFSWINLALFIRKVPSIGIFVIMFVDVTISFMRFTLVYTLFGFAFSLTFYMLLQNQVVFGSWWESFIKTSVMTIGEIDYTSIFYSCDDSVEQCDLYSSENVPYTTFTFVFFVIFITMMPIIVMNLLVGMAVDDIQSVQRNASYKNMIMKINLALDVEYLLPERLRLHFKKMSLTIFPNKNKNRSKLFSIFGENFVSAERIHTEIENSIVMRTDNSCELKMLKRDIKQLQDENKQLNLLCRRILDKLE